MRVLGQDQDKAPKKDCLEFSRIGATFFGLLADAAGNDRLTAIYHHLRGEMERIFQFFFRTAEERRWLGAGAERSAFPHVAGPEMARRLVDIRIRIFSKQAC